MALILRYRGTDCPRHRAECLGCNGYLRGGGVESRAAAPAAHTGAESSCSCALCSRSRAKKEESESVETWMPSSRTKCSP
jgi:hypothetical protein